jgi:MFS family permease
LSDCGCGPFSSLAHRGFRWLLAGQAVAIMGTWIQGTAQRWLVLELTDSPFHVGVLGAVAGLPIMLFAFYGGMLADRLPRITFLLRVQGVILLQALLFGILVDAGVINFYQILFLAFLLGGGMSFEVPARQALVFDLTGTADITNALALHSSIFNLARFAGPAIAGLLMAAGRDAWCFYSKAVSAMVIIVCLMKIRSMHPEYDVHGGGNADSSARGNPLASFRETLEYLKSVPILVHVLLVVMMFGVLLLPYSVLLPSLGRDVLGLGAREYGFLGASNGLGALAAAVFVAFLGRPENRQRWWWTGTVLFPVSIMLFAVSRNYSEAMAALFASGFVMVLTSTSAISLIQINAADSMRGRLMGLFSMCFMGFFPVGSILQGWVAGLAGVRTTLFSFALAALLILLFAAFAIRFFKKDA